MIGFSLTDEQRMLQRTAREFAQNVVAPAARQVAEQPDMVPWSVCGEVYRQGAELGFTGLLLPENQGGMGGSCVDLALVMEELGAADVAVAANYFSLTATMHLLISRFGSDEQRRRYLAPVGGRGPLFSGALNEPNVAASDLFSPAPGPNIGIRTTAERDGDHYVLNGGKVAFVTNGGVADAYLVLARTNFEAPPAMGMSMFYVPNGTPGLSFGKQAELIGWKTAHHAEVYLDNVRVPGADRIGEEGKAGMLLMAVPEMPIGLAAAYVGLARAAYEYARDYAKQRVSWGKPIIEHQAVALKLADMYVETQAARLMVWEAAYACETDPQAAGMLKAPAAKTFAVDVAIKNAQRSVEILGGYGITKEYASGGYLNDAMIGYACDFTREMLRLGMVPFL
ncbi:MAG: acyl-CoA dehydrogenase family protein [Chloroflexaceae bacterium]|jgi:alkylation response protein AidB-like acyl-CoA dehydrogenase|nr:acyl-CoA dehydrogenase family protein [Chloroflexaceae bacterium]